MSTSGVGSLLPLTPVVNQGNNYINGMRLKWLTTTTFSVSAGQVRDSTDTTDILMGATWFPQELNGGGTNPASVSTAVTVSQALLGAGGLDVGTVAASTLYSVFAIGDSRGFNSGSAVMSLAAPTVGPTLPLGYDSWRYIGSVSTNSSPTIRKFAQTGAQAYRTMWYDSGTITTAGVALTGTHAVSATYVTAGTNLATLIPTSFLEVLLNVAWTPNGATDVLSLAPITIDNGTTATVGAFAVWETGNTTAVQQTFRVPADLSAVTSGVQEIVYAVSSAAGTIAFNVIGYIDQL